MFICSNTTQTYLKKINAIKNYITSGWWFMLTLFNKVEGFMYL